LPSRHRGTDHASERRSASRRLLLAGFVAALGLLAVLAWRDWREDNRVQETMGWVAHTSAVRRDLAEFLSLVQDVETSVRGYVLTGDPTFLKEFERARVRVNDQVRALCAFTRDSPRQQTNCRALEPLVARRVAIAQIDVNLRRISGFEAARREVATGEGRIAMEQLRAQLALMDAEEQTLLDQRSTAFRRETSTLRLLTATGTGVSFALLITVLALVLKATSDRANAARYHGTLENMLEGIQILGFD